MARLTARAVGLIARPGEQTHRMIADRVFDTLGSISRPIRFGHDLIASVSYTSVRGAAAVVGEVVAAASVFAGAGRVAWLDGSVAGSGVVAAVNGLLGDQLAADANDLDLGMALRHSGRDLPVRTPDLRAAYPAAGEHLVLLLHGLGETEHAWRYRRSRQRPADPDYGKRLAADLGATPLYLRYNTGQPLTASGAALSNLLDELLERWPVPVARIDLIGHSMGGLVARVAGAHGIAAGFGWPELVRHVVYLGSPHTGAALARGATAVAGLLGARAASRAWGEFLDLRSAGIRDLSAGLPPPEAVPLPSAAHHTVVAEVTRAQRHPVGQFLGDLLVRSDSAELDTGDLLRIAPAHHFDLLNHPDVYRALRTWLSSESAR